MVAAGSRGASRRDSSNFIPAVGNFSVQYNFTSASAAVSFLNDPECLAETLQAGINPTKAGSRKSYIKSYVFQHILTLYYI